MVFRNLIGVTFWRTIRGRKGLKESGAQFFLGYSFPSFKFFYGRSLLHVGTYQRQSWDTARPTLQLLNMEIKDASSTAVLQVLEKDNYVAWSVRVKTYLMAQDLWETVEATTEPPKQEDEAAFKAWNDRNSRALHVIQKSCGKDTLSVIKEISSAKSAWNTLAEKYNISKNTGLTQNTSSGLTQNTSSVLKLLEKDNYVDWSVRIKTYLMAHDFWDIIEATTEPPRKEDEFAFKAWSKKNSKALHIIQISCGPDTFSGIIEIPSAKIAWDTLAEKYNVPGYEALKRAVERGDWKAAEEFLKHQPGAAVANITIQGETALHVAVNAGQEHMVEKLVDVMSEEELAIKNSNCRTALAETANTGNYRMAACMLRKNKKLVSIKDKDQLIPVIKAMAFGHIDLARYLYSLTPLEDLNSENGARLCTQAIYTRTLDIALDLIHRCPSLTCAQNSPLYALASMASAFPSGSRLVFWKRWIYSCIHVQLASSTEEIRMNIQNVEKRQSDPVKIIGSVLALLRQLVSNLLNFLGIKDLYEMKLVHVQSLKLLDRMCKQVSVSNNEQRLKGLVYDAIFRSIERGNFEFIFHIVRASPDLLWRTNYKEHSRPIFSCAVLHRQAKIFSLIYRLDVKNALTDWVDHECNSVLHMAGMAGGSILLNQIPGAALQMQRELQWFKEVESIVPPKIKESLNKDRLTPRELFTKNHEDLMKKGEQWMKETATSCTVVGALIVTIMFAAAFTVPGGNNQDTGFPLFLNKKLFMLFIISDALSLFSSSASVLMFLGILTSRYAEDDFLESLPRKMIIGLSTLFFSIAAMMIAFSTSLLIMLHGQSWIFIPVICLASVPITLFVLMQFPLLADMFISTYGPGIFDKQMEHWV